MKNKFIIGIAFICVMSFIFPMMIAAEKEEITYDLREKKTNHQFIITGDDNDFEVTMILPDGTEVDHRSEEHTSELQSRGHLVCRLLLEKKRCQSPHRQW